MDGEKSFWDHLKIFVIGDWRHFRQNWKQNEVVFYISLAVLVIGFILLGASFSMRSVGFQGSENFYIQSTADILFSFSAEMIIPAVVLLTRFIYPEKSYWVAFIVFCELLLVWYIFANLDLLRLRQEPNIFASMETYRAYMILDMAITAAIEVFGTFVIFALIENVQELTNHRSES